MGPVNKARLLLGGIVAGLIINLFEGVTHGLVFVNRDAEMLTRLGLSPSGSAGGIIALNMWGFAVGLLIVRLYTALRRGEGPGPKTAFHAALYVWAGASALAAAVPGILGIYKLDMAMVDVSIEFVAFALAGIAGAALYRD